MSSSCQVKIENNWLLLFTWKSHTKLTENILQSINLMVEAVVIGRKHLTMWTIPSFMQYNASRKTVAQLRGRVYDCMGKVGCVIMMKQTVIQHTTYNKKQQQSHIPAIKTLFDLKLSNNQLTIGIAKRHVVRDWVIRYRALVFPE